jgi:hypothetical protein
VNTPIVSWETLELRDRRVARRYASVPMRRVSLVDFPLQVGIKARQHRESLLREFAIIAAGGGDRADVPKRLLEIAKLHEDRYAGLNPEADERIDTAIKARSGFITIDLDVPERVKGDTVDVAPLLREVDQYCRDGSLLTLQPSDEVRAFWAWMLIELVRQLSGAPPVSWHDFELPPGL